MDPRLETARDDPVVITGFGHVIAGADGPACDPLPFLKVKKLRKYMGVQDDLAVVAAGKALHAAGLGGSPLGERAGLYLVVGCIPFERSDLEPLLAASVEGDAFSMARFSTTGYRAVNGLLTFRCLPNMPAFHISVHFDVQGPYFVTYSGPGQFYLALEEACAALEAGTIDVALAGGVAHQRNFLVAYHFGRLDPPVAAERLLDAAGCLVLERAATTKRRGVPIRGRLLGCHLAYRSFNPFEESPAPAEGFTSEAGDCRVPGEMGPASLPVMLSLEAGRGSRRLRHALRSRDGFAAASTWGLP